MGEIISRAPTVLSEKPPEEALVSSGRVVGVGPRGEKVSKNSMIVMDLACSTGQASTPTSRINNNSHFLSVEPERRF